MRFLVLLIMFCCPFFYGDGLAEARDNGKLEKIVVLSRHGVRAPTESESILSLWSRKAWPVWPVARGDLTPRGARLVTAMWKNIGASLQKDLFFPSPNELEQKDIYVRADTDERTKATAAAILEGIGPEKKLGYYISQAAVDPLFHPVKAGLYRYDAIHLANDILKMTNGGLENLQDEFSGVLDILGNIMGPPASSLCARFALMPQCQLADLPNAISISPDGTGVRLVGGLGVGSSVAEIFLLEYGEWPDSPAGWGKVDNKVISQILPVHSRIFDVINRAPVVAWANGSSLVTEMAAALFNEHPDKRVNEARLVVFVGHDTNIANVGGIMNYIWQANGYPPNDIPPASALFLELWRYNNEAVVKARFFAQPPAALHASFSGETAVTRHAPKEADVYYRNNNEKVSFSAKKFKEYVSQHTLDAPLAPAQSVELIYGSPIPQPASTQEPKN